MKKEKSKKMTKNQYLVEISLLIAFSYLGSLIKIQGTIALDALPAYFGALLLGPLAGAIIGFLGHLLTAMTSGFPMSLPLHLFIASSMAVTVGLFGYAAEKVNLTFALLVGALLNGPISTIGASYLAVLLGLGFSGKTMFFALVLPLTLTSLVNILGGITIYKAVGRYIGLEKSHEISRS